MHRVLIIEDDEIIAASLCEYIGQWGYETKTIVEFQAVMKEFIVFDPQLVLLDISLPFYDF